MSFRILPRKTSGCCRNTLLHFFLAVSTRDCILFCTAPISQLQLWAQIPYFISSVFCSAAKNLMGFCLSVLGIRWFDLGPLWFLRGKYIILNYVANLMVVCLKISTTAYLIRHLYDSLEYFPNIATSYFELTWINSGVGHPTSRYGLENGHEVKQPFKV
jgi:hypothetical protein